MSLAALRIDSPCAEVRGSIYWSNSVTNTADARRMMGGWADNLVGFLEAHYK